jgi:hypothetical protein
MGRSAAVVLQACPPPIKVVQPGRHIEAAGIDAETGHPKLGGLSLSPAVPPSKDHQPMPTSERSTRAVTCVLVVGTRIPVKLSTGTHEAQPP